MALGSTQYQVYFLGGVKAAGAYGWQPYHLQMLIVLKSGSLNLLEPSGPVQACNGIAIPLHQFSTSNIICPVLHIHSSLMDAVCS